MPRSLLVQQHAHNVVLPVLILAATLCVSDSAVSQETTSNRSTSKVSGPYPRLPGAASKAPSWLGSEAPFDVAKFFAAPPRDRNAAPLYLDALFEFSDELAPCFPEGPERERRRQVAKDRSKNFNDRMQPFYNKPETELPMELAEEVIKPYEVGFRKLQEAQRRDQCVFETGFGIDALEPHAQATRVVTRIATLRVQRSVRRGDFDGAIRDIELILRLIRDLQHRGGVISQLVASAVTNVVGFTMVPAILSSPDLKTKDCDKLVKVLVTHDQKSTDGYAEGLRKAYVDTRATLRDLVLHQRELGAKLGVKPGASVTNAILTGAIGRREAGSEIPADVDARLARTTPALLAQHEREIERYYRTALSFDGLPAATLLTKLPSLPKVAGSDPISLVTAKLVDPQIFEPLVTAVARGRATLRAVQCLVAVRRWQLAHKAFPRSLRTAVGDAGLRSIPIDPYDGQPLRMAMISDQPIVYSVGRDGKDDGGQKDSKYDTQKGDLLYHLPAIEAHRPIRPARNRFERARASIRLCVIAAPGGIMGLRS